MSVIAPSTLASAGAPSRLTNPAIPHIYEGDLPRPPWARGAFIVIREYQSKAGQSAASFEASLVSQLRKIDEINYLRGYVPLEIISPCRSMTCGGPAALDDVRPRFLLRTRLGTLQRGV